VCDRNPFIPRSGDADAHGGLIAGADRPRSLFPGAADGYGGRSSDGHLPQPGARAGERALLVHSKLGRPDAGTAAPGGVYRLPVQGPENGGRFVCAHDGDFRGDNVEYLSGDPAALPGALPDDAASGHGMKPDGEHGKYFLFVFSVCFFLWLAIEVSDYDVDRYLGSDIASGFDNDTSGTVTNPPVPLLRCCKLYMLPFSFRYGFQVHTYTLFG